MTQLLGEAVATERGAAVRARRQLTDAHRATLKPELVNGFTRTYQKDNEDGFDYPDEETLVHVRCSEMVGTTREILTPWFDAAATKEWGNYQARANVEVAGRIVISDAPVPYLLFLLSQLTDLHTFVEKLPTLDPKRRWTWDEAASLWRLSPEQEIRSEKVRHSKVMAEPTQYQPALLDTWTQDQRVGVWTRERLSGALPVAERDRLLRQVERLIDAVKQARERANATEVDQRRVAADLFDYLFAAPATDVARS